MLFDIARLHSALIGFVVKPHNSRAAPSACPDAHAQAFQHFDAQ